MKNQFQRRGWLRVAIASVVTVAAGCGIDQGGHRSPNLTADGVVVVSGPITGFGSVHVNGLTLDTAQTEVRIDGSAAAQSDLRVGQVIRAVAVFDSGAARAVSLDYEENVRGTVTAVDAPAGELVVLGQRVHVDGRTRFAAPFTTLGDIASGDRIAVSGIASSAGVVHATYIEPADARRGLQLTAAIAAVDTADFELIVGGLTVDYAQAVLLELPAGQPSPGLVVEVTGATLVGDTLIAERLRALPLLPGTFTAAATALTGAEQPAVGSGGTSGPTAANFIGIVTARTDALLTFGDVEVALLGSTVVVGGVSAALVPGVRLQVEGRIVGAGRIDAARIVLQ